MAKETLGYVRLQWTCPNCSTKNLGSDRFCANCGAPQPEDVEFEQASQEELLANEEEINRAKAGPDVHCYYCGSRNRPEAAHCTQCGADLSQATKRTAGTVLGGYHSEPAEQIICPSCGTPNEPRAPKCMQCGASLVQPTKPEPSPPVPQSGPVRRSRAGLFGGIGLGVIVLVLCAAGITFFVLAGRTNDVSASVREATWTRTVSVEGLVPVTYENWRDDIPAGAPVQSCTQKIHHTQAAPALNADRVCGTPYVVDQGSGYGEVVKDCEYHVYEDFCEYTVEEWRQIDTTSLSGTDLNPNWPNPALSPDERLGGQNETYQVIFETDQGQYTYTTGDPVEFARYTTGSRWLLKVNTFNSVVATQPAN